MNKINIPIFTSHYSIGKSILTLGSPEKEIRNDSSISIFSIAKINNLSEIFLLETSFSGFVEAYNNSNTSNIPFRFGIKLLICNDINDKSNESLKTECKVNLWIKNNKGYSDLIKIYSLAATNGFYYEPRLDWKTLEKMLTENIVLTIPFYDSFLFNNNLKRHTCLPSIDFSNIFFHIENHELPFTQLITNQVQNFSKNIINSHSIYYYSEDDLEAYMTFRCATNPERRTLLTEPNLEHFGSNKFSFESYLKL